MPAPSAARWIGRVISALVVLFLLFDGATLLIDPANAHALLAATGFADSAGPVIAALAIGSAILYAFPGTAVLGAILITGFLGGAICTHFRLGEIGAPAQLISLLLGVMAWGGLYLRNAQLRGLLPLVDPSRAPAAVTRQAGLT